MTDTTDQLALTSAFMRPYIALARKHEYYKLVRTRMAAELAGAPAFPSDDIRDEYSRLVLDIKKTAMQDLLTWTLSERIYCDETYFSIGFLADTVARTALVCAIAADENLDPFLEPGSLNRVRSSPCQKGGRHDRPNQAHKQRGRDRHLEKSMRSLREVVPK